MSTLERIVKSLEKLKAKCVIDGDYQRAENIKVVIDKIKKRIDEAL
jgi:hypothetical protein